MSSADAPVKSDTVKYNTVKHRIGKVLLPLMPVNRRTFDILRYELHAARMRFGNRLSLRQRRTIRRLANARDLSVNLGSGGTGLDGWVNVEFRRMKDTVLQLDLRHPLPLANESARRVFIEHVLEHLDFRRDAPALVREAYRVLQPGGTFRVIVPDMEKYARAYVSGKHSDWNKVGWNLDAMPADIYTPMHILNHSFHQEGEHLFGYDFETMQWLLRQAGFTMIAKMAFRQSVDPELAIDQDEHRKYSLYVDAVK